MSFEEVALRCLARGGGRPESSSSPSSSSPRKQQDADLLSDYLESLLSSRVEASAKTQRTMLSTWLGEVVMRDESDAREASAAAFFASPAAAAIHGQTALDLLEAHGLEKTARLIAGALGAQEALVTGHMRRREWKEAADALFDRRSHQRAFGGDPEVLYAAAPHLMDHAPGDLLLLLQRASLMTLANMNHILPALLAAATTTTAAEGKDQSSSSLHPAVACLEGALFFEGGGPGNDLQAAAAAAKRKKKKEKAPPHVRKALFELYAQQTDDDGGGRLDNAVLKWLQGEEEEAAAAAAETDEEEDPETRRTSSLFDLQYALRLCARRKGSNNNNTIDRASPHLYARLGLDDEAVDAALRRGDVALAKRLARAAAEAGAPAALRKALWLNIAKYVIDDRATFAVADAVSLLRDDDAADVLAMDDLLPLFPDFAVIDTFKVDICRALEAANADIGALKTDLADYAASADLIRADLRRHEMTTPQKKKKKKKIRSTKKNTRDEETNDDDDDDDADVVVVKGDGGGGGAGPPTLMARRSSPSVVIDADARCALSGRRLVDFQQAQSSAPPFYAFAATGILVLAPTLKTLITPLLPQADRDRLGDLDEALREAADGGDLRASEMIQLEIDAIIAHDCPMTGPVFIDTVDHPLC